MADSYHSLSLISTEKKAKSAEKMSAQEFQFSSLLFYIEEKRPSFANSSDSDIKAVGEFPVELLAYQVSMVFAAN